MTPYSGIDHISSPFTTVLKFAVISRIQNVCELGTIGTNIRKRTTDVNSTGGWTTGLILKAVRPSIRTNHIACHPAHNTTRHNVKKRVGKMVTMTINAQSNNSHSKQNK